ncbi:MAG TPA: DUF5985 family protein [Rhodanobacteraceae bacterium]|nr:DUF5985 family protein [Rhodanobacteraceae bacterium]
MSNFLYGAIAMAAAIAALFFLRFHRRTGDRFFLYFSATFALESASRVLAVLLNESEHSPWFYVLRIVAYGLIVVAIVDKNIPREPSK